MLQLSQRPLRATSVDASLFVDRAHELSRLEKAVGLRLNALLLGERGSGKTSLLHHLELRLREAGEPVRFVDAGPAGDADGLVALVAAAAGPASPPARLPAAAGPAGPGGELEELGEAAGGALVVLLDGVADPGVVHELFGRRRDAVWELPHTWVVSGNARERTEYLRPPADAFFDVVVDMEELSEDDAAELLRRRARAAREHDADAAALLDVAPDLASRTAPRTPRRLLAAARAALLAGGDPRDAVAGLHALHARAAEVGRPAAVLLAELTGAGAVSASDEWLQERLGWTRARLVQVLRQLEEQGLVTASTEARGKGRPRKLYRVGDGGPGERA